jgi:peptidoglycan/LPS O-acetylase OafA/YrhL
MGALRILLALSVVADHEGFSFGGISFAGAGVVAVESFFILSGFYMALVLRTKYRRETRRFYTARLIRLLPIYWILLLASLGISLAVFAVARIPVGMLYAFREPLPQAWLYPAAAFVNVFIIGADALMLYGNHLGFAFSHLLAIPIVWTLGAEFWFYAIAPFFLRRRAAALVAAFLLFLALRWAIRRLAPGPWSDWNYFFTPSTLHLFFLGALSYLAYEKLSPSPRFVRLCRRWGWLVFGVVAANVAFHQSWRIFGLQDYRYYLLFAASLPVVFALLKNSRLDRKIGEYSYPLYLLHGVVFSFSSPLRHYLSHRAIIALGLAVTLLGCWVLLRIDARISRWLHARFDRPETGAGDSRPPQVSFAKRVRIR